MTRRTLVLLGATAFAILLAGCGSILKEDRSGPQNDSSRTHDGGSSQGTSNSQQHSEVGNINSAGACTGSGGTDRAQEGPGEISNGKIAFQRFPLSGPPPYEELYVIDEDGTNETRLTNNPLGDEHPHWSPDGQKIAFVSLRDGHVDI
jgi:hypothetical protein